MSPARDDTCSTLRGADPAVVREAISMGDSLPGASGCGPPAMGGFGGRLDDTLVTDVLGRQPVYSEADATDPTAEDAWAFSPTELADPVAVPPGSVRRADGDDSRLRLPEPQASEPDAALTAVGDAVTAALDTPAAAVAVGFSGGVDSTLVASGFPDAPLYVVGFEGCHDIAAAREAAQAMDRSADLTVIELDHETLETAVPRVVETIGRTNPMDVAIALPLILVAEQAATDGYRRLAVGQGADELFGGYAKVVEPASDARVDSDTVRDAVWETIDTLPGQLQRDVCGLRAAGVEPVTPFLQDRVIDAALRLPGELLATPERRKVALRRVARETVGLPATVTSADKKAVQYGSYVSRELDRLARQAGYKRRMDDHVGQYIRSLCTD